MLRREEIIANVDCLRADEAFMSDIQYLLRDAVAVLDVELIRALLRLGADPNNNPDFQYAERNYGFLHDLCHRYVVECALHGKDIETVFALLLKSGADPNLAGDCNIAPIQRCTHDATSPLKGLLLKYGASPEGNTIY